LNGGAGGLKALSTSTGVATDLYVGTDRVYLFAVSGNPNLVIGRAGTGLASDPIAVVIALNETIVGGQVTDASLGMAVYGPLVHSDGTAVDDGDTLDLTDLVSLTANFATSEEHDFDSFAGVPSGSDAFAMILPDTTNNLQLIATGFSGGTNQKITISQDANAGSIGGGGPGQHIGSGNSIRIDFVTGGDFSKADTSSEDNNYANISYGSHTSNAFQASFEIVQINPTGNTTSLKVFAYDVDGNAQGATFASNAIGSEGDSVAIDPDNVHILDASGHEVTPAAGQITSIAGGGVLITGLQLDYTVKFSTPGDTFDRFTVTNAQPAKGNGSNITFDIGHVHVSTLDTGSGSASAELGSHLVFEDAGPTVDLSTETAGASVDETALGTPSSAADFSKLFTIDYGPDGKGADPTYALDVNDGDDSTLVDTATNTAILLYMDGNDVVGKVGSSSGDEAFRISVDGDGNVTLTQSRAIVHANADDPNDSTGIAAGDADLITLTATAYDNEGANSDSASATANIGNLFTFYDDAPSALAPDPDSNLIVGNNKLASPPSPELPGLGTETFTTFDPGNDGFGSFTIVGPADTTGAWTWAYSGDNSHIIESYTDPTTHVKSNIFSLALDGTTGSYTMTMLNTLPPTTDHLNVNTIKAGGPDTNFITVNTTSGGGDYVKISGFNGAGNPPTTPAAINESNANVGVANGNLDNGEAIEFQLFDSNNALIDFLGLNIGTKSAQASDYKIFVDFVDPLVTDISFTQHVLKNQAIHVDPTGDDLIQSITIEKITGPALKIGLGAIDILRPPGDAGFHYDVKLADGDGDSVTAGINVFIDGNNDGAVDTSHVLFP